MWNCIIVLCVCVCVGGGSFAAQRLRALKTQGKHCTLLLAQFGSHLLKEIFVYVITNSSAMFTC